MEQKPPLIRRVKIKNYKSIASCDVQLGSLQFLVGRNGAGKSNFLDALAFVSNTLSLNSIRRARREASYHISGSRRLSRAYTFSMRLECNLPNGTVGILEFEVRRKKQTQDVVVREKCVIEKNSAPIAHYEVRDGKIQHVDPANYPAASNDRLYLQSVSDRDDFKPLYDALTSTRFYNFNPETIKNEISRTIIHNPESNTALQHDGANIGTIWTVLSPVSKKRINEYLRIIVPTVAELEVWQLGNVSIDDTAFDKIENIWMNNFFALIGPNKIPTLMSANSMSDGTLQALGVLTALLQERGGGDPKFPPVVCIEEPENFLHARAVGILLGAVQEAADMRQVIITTHSADMLDDDDIPPEQILPVVFSNGSTQIAPLEDVTKQMLQDHLTTAGELLRQDDLKPSTPAPNAKKD